MHKTGTIHTVGHVISRFSGDTGCLHLTRLGKRNSRLRAVLLHNPSLYRYPRHSDVGCDLIKKRVLSFPVCNDDKIIAYAVICSWLMHPLHETSLPVCIRGGSKREPLLWQKTASATVCCTVKHTALHLLPAIELQLLWLAVLSSEWKRMQSINYLKTIGYKKIKPFTLFDLIIHCLGFSNVMPCSIKQGFVMLESFEYLLQCSIIYWFMR